MKSWRRLLSFILIIISIEFAYNVAFSFVNIRTNMANYKIEDKIDLPHGGFVAIVVNKDKKISTELERYFNENGKDLSLYNKKLTNSDGIFYRFSADRKLIFIFIEDSSKSFWTYKSTDTKRIGILLDKEFSDLCLKKSKRYDKVYLSKENVNKLIDLFFTLELEKKDQIIIVVFLFGLIIILSIIGFVISISKPKDVYNKWLLRFIPNAINIGYIYIIISPIMVLKISNILIQVFIFFLLSSLLSLIDLKKSLFFESILGIGIIFAQAFFGDNILQLTSVVGYHLSYANRFYGIGNEFYTYVLGFLIIISFILNINLKGLILILSVCSLIYVIPYYTVNFGAFLSLALGILFYLILQKRNKKIIISLSAIFILMTFILVKLNKYISNVFINMDTLFSVVKRKLIMNLSYFAHYPYTLLTVVIFIILFYLCVYDKRKIVSSIVKYKDKFLMYFIIAIFAFILNDSGTIIITLLLGFITTAIYYTKMVEEYAIH